MIDETNDGKKWLFRGLAICFVFIGLAIFISAILFFGAKAGTPINAFTNFGWNSIWDVLVVVFIIWLVMSMLRWTLGVPWGRRHWHDHNSYEHDKSILRRRYVRGEITKKQYQDMLKDLDDTK
jgi:uncharacterized membrane protein